MEFIPPSSFNHDHPSSSSSSPHLILCLCSLILEDIHTLITSQFTSPVSSPLSSSSINSFNNYFDIQKTILNILKRTLTLSTHPIISSGNMLLQDFQREIVMSLNYFKKSVRDIIEQRGNHFGIFDVRDS